MFSVCCDVKEAVTEAVDECIKEDVLSEFFIEHREEVIAVSVFEYDEEGHMDVVREEGREEGKKEAFLSWQQLSRQEVL